MGEMRKMTITNRHEDVEMKGSTFIFMRDGIFYRQRSRRTVFPLQPTFSGNEDFPLRCPLQCITRNVIQQKRAKTRTLTCPNWLSI